MNETESYNPNSLNLDSLDSLAFVNLFLEEDKQVWKALELAHADIAKAIDLAYEAVSSGGRIFYIGAGTSGRLGVLDASECPPTFSSDPELVQGIIAGGDTALRSAVEGAEDDAQAGMDFVKHTLRASDCLIAISASGSAPYVLAALEGANQLGSTTIAIANNKDAQSFVLAKHCIYLATGAEIISGSTRLKAGTAQKITLNMLSTGVMIKLGKVYGNLMVDVKASNKKLIKRAKALVMEICKCSETEAERALESTEFKVKQAVLKILKDWDYDKATRLLEANKNSLSKCLRL